MIYIISLVMLIVSLIGGSILVAAGPNVKAIVDRDFAKKSYSTAKLASLQYGDIALRAHTVVADPYGTTTNNGKKEVNFSWLIQKNNATVTQQNSTIRVYQDSTGKTIIDSNVTQTDLMRGLF